MKKEYYDPGSQVFDHIVSMPYCFPSKQEAMILWCTEHVDPRCAEWAWFSDWARGIVEFAFLRAEDATLFALRWV